MSRVAAAGGVPTPASTLDAAAQETSHHWPQFLPDGRHFLYLAMIGVQRGGAGAAQTSIGDTRTLYVGALDSTARTLLRRGELRAQYAAGHLLFIRDGTLMAQRFDVPSLRLTGEPAPIAERVPSNTGNGNTAFAVSEAGVLAYRTGAGSADSSSLVWLDRSGKPVETVGAPGAHSAVWLSPDGKTAIAYVQKGAGSGSITSSDLWAFDLARGGIPSRLTFTADQFENGLAFNPTGDRVAFASGSGGSTEIYQKAIHGGGEPELLLKSPLSKRPTSWSSDGRYLAFTQTDPKTAIDIWLLPAFGDRKPVPFLQTSFSESNPAISPDGRWMAYQSDKSGTPEIYVRAFPSGDREWRISQSGGAYPQWRGDGRELFYVGATPRSVMAVGFKGTATLDPSAPVKLFDAPFLVRSNGSGQVAVSADGQRFLVIEPQPAQDTHASALTIVLNWTDALRK